MTWIVHADTQSSTIFATPEREYFHLLRVDAAGVATKVGTFLDRGTAMRCAVLLNRNGMVDSPLADVL